MVKPWDTATIGDFLDFKNGLNKGKEFFGYGTPIVNYTDVYRKRGLTKSDVRGKVNLTRDEIHRFDARKNDVFFTRTSETPEEVGMSSVLLDDIDDCVFSGFVLRGRPKNDMFVPEYCKYCFTTEGIKLDYITNNEIVISWDAIIAQQKGFKRWKKGVVDTKKWMCVRVADEDDHVRITFY